MSSIAYCDNVQDVIYKEEYSFLPSEAVSISVQKTSNGVFIYYYMRGSCPFFEHKCKLNTIYLSDKGEVKNLKEELVKTLYLIRPEFLDKVDLDEVSICVNGFNDKVQAVGKIYFSLYDCDSISLPFFWSPNECAFLPGDHETIPEAINNHGIIVGFKLKTYKTYKNKTQRIPVVWTFDSVKEIALYLDSENESRGISENFYEISIDDENYIHFKSIIKIKQVGSIHLSELN